MSRKGMIPTPATLHGCVFMKVNEDQSTDDKYCIGKTRVLLANDGYFQELGCQPAFDRLALSLRDQVCSFGYSLILQAVTIFFNKVKVK